MANNPPPASPPPNKGYLPSTITNLFKGPKVPVSRWMIFFVFVFVVVCVVTIFLYVKGENFTSLRKLTNIKDKTKQRKKETLKNKKKVTFKRQ